VPEALVPLRRNRDFALLWSGMAVSVLGSRISTIAYPLLVLALTDSPARAGFVGFLATLPYLAFQLPAGALVDRWNRKSVMVACDVGRGVALASVVLALWLDAITLAHIMAVAFVEGTLFVFYNLAQSAAVRNIVPLEQLPQALAQNEARERGAVLLGQPVGAILFGVARWVPFLADALSYVASLLTLALIRKEFQADRPRERRRLTAEVWEGVVWLWRQSFLRDTALLVAGSNLLFQALFLIVIVIAREQGASATVIGVMLAGFGLGGVLGSLAAPAIQRGLPMNRVVIGANWVWAVLVPAIAIAPNPYVLGGILALMAFVGPAWNVVVGAYQLAITPDRLLARVSSAETLVAYGAIPLGSLAAGLLLEGLGTVPATLALAAWMLALAVAATASPSIRNAPGRFEPHAAAPVSGRGGRC
jgi:predicted MFS family arabinose efflux permease